MTIRKEIASTLGIFASNSLVGLVHGVMRETLRHEGNC